MADREARALEALADAVAEGEAVDWDAAARRLRSRPALDVADALRALATIGPRESSRARAGSPRIPLWFAAYSHLALLQVAGGLLALLWVPWDRQPIPPALLAMNAVSFSAAAVALPRLRPLDPRLRDLAGVFFAIAAACSHRPLRWLVEAGHGAWPLVSLRALLPDAFLAFFLWRFAGAFPRVLRLTGSDALAGGMGRLAGWVAAALFTCNAMAYTMAPVQPSSVPVLGMAARTSPSGLYWLLEFGLAAGALAVIAWRSRQAAPAERPRVAFFAAGLTIGLAPLLVIILLEYTVATAKQYIEGRGLYLVGYAIYLPLATVPFTVSYSLAAARLPSPRMARSWILKAVLGRRALVAAALLPLAMLAFFVYVNRERSTAAVLGGPLASTLLAISICAGAVLFLRDRLAGRFLPENRLSALLAGLTATTRAAPSLSAAAEAVSSHVREGTSAESATLFARAASQQRFNAVRKGARPLPFDSAIGLLVEQSDHALFVDPRDPQSTFAWLPAADREWVVDNDVAAVIGMRAGSSEVIAVLGLGPKPDGRSWTSGDAAFLAAAAGAAGLALEGRGLGRSAIGIDTLITEGCAVECRQCGRVTEAAGGRCACGGALTESLLPPVLRGKFRIERILGRGGMGVVYQGTDLDLHRRVALKTLPGVTPEAALRLRQEARSMAALVHPNLAVIFGAESWRGVPVLVVELLESGTLADRLPGPLPAREVLGWGASLAQALEAMHGNGVLHRDVKPSNIGFTASGAPKLLDFGLARLMGDEGWPKGVAPGQALADDAAGSITRSGHVIGTPLYMSANIRAGGAPGPADDLWSLTLVLYEAIAGCRSRADGAPLDGMPDGPLTAPLRDWFAGALDPRGAGFRTASELRQELARLRAQSA
jgi:hypothetical protein